jgi:hypothetical protein
MAGIGAERQAIVNVYVSLKSRPFLVLAGEKQTGKIELVKRLGQVLTEIPALQCQFFVGHARWAAQSQNVSHFVEMQDRFNRDNLLALIEEASQKENASRLFIACLTRISPAELYEFFAIPGLQFWPYQTYMEGNQAVAPAPYPPNFRLLGTMDVPHFNGWEEDLLVRTTVVRWPGERVESKMGDGWMNTIAHLHQSFLPTCVSSEQTAYARLQRILGGQREAFLPLVQVLDLMHLHDASPPRELIGEVICYLANSWTRAGAGLFDPTPLINLNQALDLALAQYVLPWIVAVQPEPDRLLKRLNDLFDGQFKRTSTFIANLQTGHRNQGFVSQIAYDQPGTFA